MLNTRSIVNKISDITAFIYSSPYSVLCFTETWLNDNIFSSEILSSGYTIYRKDRSSRGGGVLVAVRENLSAFLINSPDNLEVLTIKLGSVNHVTLCTVYVPPNSKPEYHKDLLDYLVSLGTTSNLVIVGDFNCPDINW